MKTTFFSVLLIGMASAVLIQDAVVTPTPAKRDPLKDATEMLTKDTENHEAQWQPKPDGHKVEPNKPITICEAQTDDQ